MANAPDQSWFSSWPEKVTAAIAVIALVQPWVIALWKRLFRPGGIGIHETGTIEVGYSNFGPTIGLQGTLQALHHDQFVSNVQVDLVKAKDHSRHQLPWLIFRPSSTKFQSGAASSDTTLEIASGFMVARLQPHRFNIIFNDVAVQREVQPMLEAFKAGWVAYRDANLRDAAINKVNEIASEAAAAGAAGLVNLVTTALQEYAKTSTAADALKRVERACYWEAGRYTLTMTVATSNPERTHPKQWDFVLTEEDAEALRKNFVAAAAEACGVGQLIPYQFRYATYLTRQ